MRTKKTARRTVKTMADTKDASVPKPEEAESSDLEETEPGAANKMHKGIEPTQDKYLLPGPELSENTKTPDPKRRSRMQLLSRGRPARMKLLPTRTSPARYRYSDALPGPSTSGKASTDASHPKTPQKGTVKTMVDTKDAIIPKPEEAESSDLEETEPGAANKMHKGIEPTQDKYLLSSPELSEDTETPEPENRSRMQLFSGGRPVRMKLLPTRTSPARYRYSDALPGPSTSAKSSTDASTCRSNPPKRRPRPSRKRARMDLPRIVPRTRFLVTPEPRTLQESMSRRGSETQEWETRSLRVLRKSSNQPIENQKCASGSCDIRTSLSSHDSSNISISVGSVLSCSSTTSTRTIIISSTNDDESNDDLPKPGHKGVYSRTVKTMADAKDASVSKPEEAESSDLEETEPGAANKMHKGIEPTQDKYLLSGPELSEGTKTPELKRRSRMQLLSRGRPVRMKLLPTRTSPARYRYSDALPGPSTSAKASSTDASTSRSSPPKRRPRPSRKRARMNLPRTVPRTRILVTPEPRISQGPMARRGSETQERETRSSRVLRTSSRQKYVSSPYDWSSSSRDSSSISVGSDLSYSSTSSNRTVLIDNTSDEEPNLPKPGNKRVYSSN